MREKKTYPCFVCEEPLTQVFGGDDTPQCDDGTMFSATGNYGSSLWDPMPLGPSYEELVINICDKCLEPRAHLVQRAKITKPDAVVEYRAWDPKEPHL